MLICFYLSSVLSFFRAAQAKISAFKIIFFVNGAGSAKASFLRKFTVGFSFGAIENFRLFFRAFRLDKSRASDAKTFIRVFLVIGHFWHKIEN
jgi:hypothetical protein